MPEDPSQSKNEQNNGFTPETNITPGSTINIEPSPDFKPETIPDPPYVNRRPDSKSFNTPTIVRPETEIETAKEQSQIRLVLQWLTYAFWGFTVLAMSTLVVVVLQFFFVKDAMIGDFPLYSMAAVLVLLPVATICDILYKKREPEEKKGADSAITVIHSYLFALFAIGSLITVAFSLATLFVNGSNPEYTLVALYSALIIAVLFVLLFLRTILPSQLRKFRTQFVIVMVAFVLIICGFAFFGPVMDARLAKNDRLIESNIDRLAESVNSYVSSNKMLPSDLNTLKLTGDTKQLVTDKLVTYKKDTKPSSRTYSGTEHYYQLCVNYRKEKSSDYPSSSYKPGGNEEYSSYISGYYHPSGDVCYKVSASYYSYSNDDPYADY